MANTLTARSKQAKIKAMALRIIFTILLGGLAFTMIIPFLWMISASMKHALDVTAIPIKWIPDYFYPNNYKEVWNIGGNAKVDYDAAESQTLYAAQNVCCGEHRVWNAPNLWQSAADDLHPKLTLSWENPACIREIRMYLDPNLLMELPSSRTAHIEPSHVYEARCGMPEHLIKDMMVTAFDEREVPFVVWNVKENIQRILVLQLDKLQKISKLTVAIQSTWGQAEPRIFRISAYEQCLTDGLKAEILNGEREE